MEEAVGSDDGHGVVHTASRRLARRDTTALRVVGLSLTLATLAGVLLLWGDTGQPFQDQRIPLLLLFVLFVGAELPVLHIQVRREAQAVSLSEIPLVVGLFFADATDLVAARLAGTLLVLVVVRKSSPIKTLFNTGMILAETSLALVVAHAIVGDVDPTGAPSWVAAFAAVSVMSVFSVLALSAVIGVYEGLPPVGELVREVATATIAPLVLSSMALMGIATLQADPAAIWLVLAATAALVVSYRAYASLWDRHLSLERLYQFSQVVGSSPEVDEVLRNVLVQARDLLRSEQATAVFFDPDGTRAAVVHLAETSRFTRHEDRVDGSRWLAALLSHREASALISRNTVDLRDRELLESRDLREAVVVPLRSGSQANAVLLVGDRMGEVRAFDQSDVVLLETVANHAGMALQNGHLIDRLRHDALHDSLTSLPNRAALQRRLQEALSDRPEHQMFGVMIIDLDGFKEVNDSLGHHQGDRLLVEVAERFAAAVGDDGMTARLGGDEFAVVTRPVADTDGVHRLARRLLCALELPVALEGMEIEIGASVGVAFAPEHGRDGSSLLRAADMAMYHAKASTGGVKVFEPQLGGESSRRLFVVGELRQALHCDGLTVHVQPKASLTTGHVASVEALIRWEHPELGAICPDEFIPLAERSGLIQQLTAFVLDAGVSACARWRFAGEDIGVAVNISTRSLLDADVVSDVRRVLSRHRVPATSLTLEITESAAMAEPGRAAAILEQLSSLGVRLSVDDFGTGYSSLSYLRRLPVDEVKIDRSFIRALGEDGEDAAIVGSIISLGRHLGLQVVAEGIEDHHTWRRLESMGCALGQGYYLGRPMPVEDFLGWLSDYRTVPRRGVRSVVNAQLPG